MNLFLHYQKLMLQCKLPNVQILSFHKFVQLLMHEMPNQKKQKFDAI